ncbi:hypothetical protein [Microbacterium capsulatum]|uniref:Secreted protein n=1 Tax=Microbacterium capsulatum TaxID=3041921 RepID=A0ABU0XJQ6_9MICO|nr:hypothetical protein [Microbacterium sp. ASV81]MDQ4214879.1 hypothetical protein [Microbacterium sp. ASV81]
MMKQLTGLGATALLAAAMIVGAAAPASANTTSTTHSNTINDAIPVTCDGPGWTAFWGTGNMVTHLTVNNAGDSWFTTTQEGTVTLTTMWGGSSGTWMGHVQEWFGSEDNNKSSVQHATFNFQGVNVSDSSKTLAMHAAFTMTTNANGTLVVNNQTVSCG